MKYGLHGKLDAAPGKGKALAAILLEAAELVAKSKGCHVYLVSQVTETPDEVWITEAWDSKEDHDASLQNPAVRALIGKAMPLIGSPPQKGQELEILGGLGISNPK